MSPRASTTWRRFTTAKGSTPRRSRSTNVRLRSGEGAGPEHPDVAQSLNNLAVLYHNRGEYAEAEPLYQRSLAVWQKALGPEHSMWLRASTTWPSFTAPKGTTPRRSRYTNVRSRSGKGAGVRAPQCGPEPEQSRIALLQPRGVRRSGAAVSTFARGLEKALGPEHPNLAQGLNNLAALYHNQGKYAEAEPLYNVRSRSGRRSWGPSIPM